MIKNARIIKIKASGVIVQLETGEEAWLPARELSTQYNPAIALTKQELCSNEQILEVLEYGGEINGNHKLVSHIRVKNDPWEKVTAWHENDVKEMEVHSVTTTRAFGEIEPGIVGYINLEEINNHISFPSSWFDFKTIAVGDMVAGYVDTHKIDHDKRVVKLNVTSYIKNLKTISTLLPILDHSQQIARPGKNPSKMLQGEIFKDVLKDVQHFFMVDDSESLINGIKSYLHDMGFQIHTARSFAEVEEILADPETPDFEVALLDVHLTTDSKDYKGLKIGHLLQKKQPRCRIIITTGDDHWSDEFSAHGRDLLISFFLYKPFALDALSFAIAAAIREKPKALRAFFEEAGGSPLEPSPIPSESLSLATVLQNLQTTIKSESVILFRIHPLSLEVKIVEFYGNVNERIDDNLPKLRYSPVNDVALNEEVIFEQRVSLDAVYAKHRWLRESMDYESCIAFPVQFTHEWRYALFTFHSYPQRFEEKDKYMVKSAAMEIAHILEIKRFQEMWRSETPFILAGKTYGSMAHDLGSALTMDGIIRDISKILENKTFLKEDDLEKIKKGLSALQKDTQRVKGIVDTFRRMSRSHLELETDVDVFSLTNEVLKNIEIEAKSYQTKIEPLAIEEGLSGTVKIRRTSMEQVLYNLLLNAVQQIHRFSFAREEGHVKFEFASTQTGGRNWLQILIHDTGPGIHAHDYEEVFKQGYSTKDSGCGMGLDICRGIIGKVGGKVRVLKSILFIGSTFEVLLPLNKKGRIPDGQNNENTGGG